MEQFQNILQLLIHLFTSVALGSIRDLRRYRCRVVKKSGGPTPLAQVYPARVSLASTRSEAGTA